MEGRESGDRFPELFGLIEGYAGEDAASLTQLANAAQQAFRAYAAGSLN